MRFHAPLDDAYAAYGVQPSDGALAVIRPDGYVGIISALDDTDRIKEYLERCLRRI